MRIFLAGDHYSGTGPANVTKYYIQNLPQGTLYQKRRNKAARLLEIAAKTLLSDVVVYSGYSKQNIPGLRLAKLLNIPTAYIMHGCVEYENSINLEPDEEMNRVERRTLELSDKVIAVSHTFAAWLKGYYPLYGDKFDYVDNGIDTSLMHCQIPGGGRNSHMIFSIGGGMPRKKIKYICAAVAHLRKTFDPEMFLCVIGDEGADSDEINSYDFVDNRGLVSFDESVRLFGEAALFIQNSSFETFGLAPVEALSLGCPILCSRQVGALELINGLEDTDVIDKYDDPEEIAAKIKFILENPNAKRLCGGLDKESYSWKARSRALEAKLSELISPRH